MTIKTFIEVEVEVEFNYHRARRGMRDSCGGVRGAGAPLEPDEDAEVELTSVKFMGQEVELDANQQERIEQECWDAIADSCSD